MILKGVYCEESTSCGRPDSENDRKSSLTHAYAVAVKHACVLLHRDQEYYIARIKAEKIASSIVEMVAEHIYKLSSHILPLKTSKFGNLMILTAEIQRLIKSTSLSASRSLQNYGGKFLRRRV